jgi:hypothetical protein
LVAVQPVKSALRLAAVNDAAARLGLNVGMALADAKAMYPTLAVADADPEADRHLLEAIADWCDRWTPLIGLDPPDGLTLDITGCAHLFGGEAAFCGTIVQRLGLQGFAARAAIADTVGCAWAVARHGCQHPFLQGEGRIAEGSPGRGPGHERNHNRTPTRLAARATLPLSGGGKDFTPRPSCGWPRAAHRPARPRRRSPDGSAPSAWR